MAPEQLEGKPLDARTDIFALGAVLYEMATGKKAFVGRKLRRHCVCDSSRRSAPISAVRPGSPVALDRLVRTCLAKDPEHRWQTAHDVGLQLAAMRESSSSLFCHGCRRYRSSDPGTRWSVGSMGRGRRRGSHCACCRGCVRCRRRMARRAPIRFEIPPPAGGAFFDAFSVETMTLATVARWFADCLRRVAAGQCPADLASSLLITGTTAHSRYRERNLSLLGT